MPEKMPENVRSTLMLMYSDRIYKLIEDRDEMDDGDFAGAIEAVVLTLLDGNHNDMYKQILKMGA